MTKRGRQQAESLYWVALSAILILTAWLRFNGLGDQSLWIDETMTWVRVSVRWDQVLPAVRNSPNLPLSYLLIKPVVDALGDGEFWLRSISALTGTLAVTAAWKIGREAGGQAGGLTAAWAWAVHPMAVFFGRDAKTYAISSALAAALLALHLHMRRSKRQPWHWLAAFGLLASGLLSHYYFFFAAMLLALSAALQLHHDPAFFRGWLAMTIAAAVPVLLWVGWFYALDQPMLGNGWIDMPTWLDLPSTLWNLLSGYGGRTELPTLAFGGLMSLLALCAVLFGRERRTFTLTALVAIFAPMLFMLAVSQRKPLYMDRYFIVLLPFIIFVVAGGAGSAWEWLRRRVRPSQLRTATKLLTAAALVAGSWIGFSVHSGAQYQKEDWRGLVSYLKAAQASEIRNTNLAPLLYYGFEPRVSESCEQSCWLILYRPYMPAHEFTNSIEHPDRPWLPELATKCTIVDEWFSPTNVGAWKLDC